MYHENLKYNFCHKIYDDNKYVYDKNVYVITKMFENYDCSWRYTDIINSTSKIGEI